MKSFIVAACWGVLLAFPASEIFRNPVEPRSYLWLIPVIVAVILVVVIRSTGGMPSRQKARLVSEAAERFGTHTPPHEGME